MYIQPAFILLSLPPFPAEEKTWNWVGLLPCMMPCTLPWVLLVSPLTPVLQFRCRSSSVVWREPRPGTADVKALFQSVELLSPPLGMALSLPWSGLADCWWLMAQCNTVLWGQALGKRAPKRRSSLLAQLGLKKCQWEKWPKHVGKNKFFLSSLPRNDVILLVWVAIWDRVTSEAWRFRHRSPLHQRTLLFLDLFY